ncbi:MAG TPA: hypothetical protein VMU11_03540 [Verrucomicrobiae bacterium]|nr:hypothetical protein [Verrucomicrobiae bacterium]
MIPLVYFLFAWLVLVLLFAIAALVSVIMALRFGLTGPLTTFSTAIFLGVACIVLIGMAAYLAGVDWSQSISLFNFSPSNLLGPTL